MSLQIDMISQINMVGRKKLINRLDFYSRMVHEKDKVYFDNLVVYFDNLYKTAIPDEKNTVRFRQNTLTTLDVINKYNKELNCKILQFTKKLIQYRLNAVKRKKQPN